jgi:DNA-binding transcriptional regulator YdaS (Cro superfamily)
MRKEDVVRYFGTQKAVAVACGVTQSAVSQWDDIIPPLKARQIAELTRGKLPFDARLYRHASERSRELASALSS